MKNEFLPFGIADGANVLTNEEYNQLASRTNGFSSGVAKSQELNKVWRQASVIAAVVAQFIAETNNQDVLDDGNLANLQKGLLSALKATVSSNVPNASLTTAGITKLSNATDSNAENIAATSKAVRQVNDALNTKQDKGDYATNAALNQVNDNANSRLEKAQNGADILDKAAFVSNIGLTGTVKRANDTWLKSESDNRYIQASTLEIGKETKLSDLAGKTGFYSRASHPVPPDSPLTNAFKVLTMGDFAWPTQMVYSSYDNRAFIRTRTAPEGAFRNWAEFLTDNHLTQSTGASTTEVMSQRAVTNAIETLNKAVQSRLLITGFNALPFSFENVLTGTHGSNTPVKLRKSIRNKLIFLQHNHPGYTAVAYGAAGERLEFKFGEYGYTAFDVSADGLTLSNWKFTSGYPVSGVFIINGDAA